MFKPVNFTSVVGVAAASIVLVALSGCAVAGPFGATSSKSESSAGPVSKPADRTYTAADLTSILTAVKKSTGSSGQVITDEKLKSMTASSGGLSALLGQKGLTIEPASCGTLMTSKLPSASNGYGLGSDAIGAALISGTASSLSVSSVAGKQLPDSAKDVIGAQVDSVLATCSSMTMKFKTAGQSLSIGLKLKKIDVTTKADQSFGMQETLQLPSIAGSKGKPLVITIVEARQGNLIVAATDPLGTATADDLTNSVNAVLAAAAKLS